MSKVDVIVACHNEAPRIGRVLTVLSSSPLINKIIVVDDGSEDNSYEVAKSFPKTKVIRLRRNLGKGGAIKKAVKYATTEAVFLCDADLRGLNEEHIKKLLKAYSKKTNGLVIGHRRANRSKIRYLGRYKITPRLDGERIIKKEDLEKVLDSEYSEGYGLEAWMNYYFRKRKKKVSVVPLYGLKDGSIKRKRVKDNAIEAKEVISTYSDIYKEEIKRNSKKSLIKILS